MTHPKMWNSTKAVPEGEFLTLTEESLKINHLSFHPKKLEKEKQMKGKKEKKYRQEQNYWNRCSNKTEIISEIDLLKISIKSCSKH